MHTSLPSDPKARSRHNLIGLGIHATVYFVVGAGLVVTNLLTMPGLPWFTWSLAGWGIGLALHTVGVLRYETLTDEERRALLEREAAWRTSHRSHGGCGAGGGCGCTRVR